ncbi:MAG: right-handed parallel beta-helix repeat-containing protein [Candidatus Kariarchaeaceae archaeon]
MLASIGFVQNTLANQTNNDSDRSIEILDQVPETLSDNQIIKNSDIVYNPISSISISGDTGFTGYPGAGTIDNPYRIQGWNFTGSGTLIYVQDTSAHFVISNNIVGGTGNNFRGIWFLRVTNGVITDNVVTQVQQGIKFEHSSNNSVTNNKLHDNSRQGIAIQFEDGNNNKVINNTIFNNGEGGVALWETSHTTVSENLIYNNTGEAIHSEGPENKIKNNQIFDNSNHGIAMGSGYNNEISGNSIFQNNANGIATWSISMSDISHNKVFNNYATGISSDGNNNNIVSNSVFDNNDSGIDFTGSFSTIHSNEVFNNLMVGIGLGGTENVAENNQVYDNGDFGISAGGENNIIKNNTVFTNGNVGIGVWITNEHEISYNTVFDNTDQGIMIWSGSRNNVSYNLVYNNGFRRWSGGIAISTGWDGVVATSNIIHGNVVHENNVVGISIEGDANVVTKNDLYQNTEFPIGDEGSNNLIDNNFYDDWSGIGSYGIAGSANNEDVLPQYNPNHMSSLSITIDDGDSSVLQGNVAISWEAIEYTFDHVVTYSVFYSSDSGTSWTLFESGLTTLNYDLDTTTIPDGSTILLRVEAIDEIGFISTETSSDSYLIDNSDDNTTSSPSDKESNKPAFVNYPNLYLILLTFGALYMINRKKNPTS